MSTAMYEITNEKSDFEKGYLDLELQMVNAKEAFDAFGKIVQMDEEEMCYDMGSTKFIITYSDKTKIQKVLWRPATDFRRGFIALRDLVPHLEEVPYFLRFD